MRERITNAWDGLSLQNQVLMIGVTCVIALGAVWALDNHYGDQRVERRYCYYGAQSAAQYSACRSQVSADDIRAMDSEAASYARDEILECGDNAGAICGSDTGEELGLLEGLFGG